uniref:1-acyl-sn-glycerol-3-phosphate acyltransferase-like isoform X2 n=1 Tax=Rhizophora mucronata TaxID=61149 RepID=A0A2P2JEM8_RHIMU
MSITLAKMHVHTFYLESSLWEHRDYTRPKESKTKARNLTRYRTSNSTRESSDYWLYSTAPSLSQTMAFQFVVFSHGHSRLPKLQRREVSTKRPLRLRKVFNINVVYHFYVGIDILIRPFVCP